jgi:hypothetical protein
VSCNVLQSTAYNSKCSFRITTKVNAHHEITKFKTVTGKCKISVRYQ